MALGVIIMAGGIGKRMKSERVKVLHNLLGKPVLFYVVERAKSLNPDEIVVVYGKKGMEIKGMFSGIRYAYQEVPMGTGDAVMKALGEIEGFEGEIMVLSGDVPLLTEDTLNKLIQHHRNGGYKSTILTFYPPEPGAYGRIVREGDEVMRIVEARDATDEELQIKEVNSGIYVFHSEYLRKGLTMIDNKNAQGEYYLTDVIQKIREMGGKVGGVPADDPFEVSGINTREELSIVEDVLRKRIIKHFQENGVTFHMPDTIYIETGVSIGEDTEIYPFCYIGGNTRIGRGCTIEPFCYLYDAMVKDGERVKAGKGING
ncbi:MAG TPA: hypothetical protein ENF18_05985 [candidate division WOR-3 bacterium]|uniref:Nucleotidyl transferase domain-containing protein n=1 Tax=candidate division WOR-3 bacterium TaxID=2052148 RepID=A0A7C0ZLD2_UNCW3|nr:hypothetical protein [candidate division WOR-3 bacterium]